ncbi:unnamed protein product [Phaeothamnion confervicola]
MSMFDLSKKKKKKKKKDAVDAGEEGGDGGTDKAANYTYETLLERIQSLVHENNPELAERSRITLKPPQLMRVGTRKTLWVNFQEICKLMKRNPEHVFQFVVAELGTEGSIDGAQRLVLRGKYVPKYVESLLRKYIVEYVTCRMCRSPSTTLTREPASRLFFVHCQDCGSSRSVGTIHSGFHAQTRADRRAIRNAVK